MATYVVWVLIVSLNTGYGAGVTTVDNIASEANCRALEKSIERSGFQASCYAVRKFKP